MVWILQWMSHVQQIVEDVVFKRILNKKHTYRGKKCVRILKIMKRNHEAANN